MNEQNDALEVNIQDIPKERIDRAVLIDVRESIELRLDPVDGVAAVHLPFSRFDEWDFHFQKDKDHYIFCAHGIRSLACVERLREQGISNVHSIRSGAEALRTHISSFQVPERKERA